jgi:hypothetical protein
MKDNKIIDLIDMKSFEFTKDGDIRTVLIKFDDGKNIKIPSLYLNNKELGGIYKPDKGNPLLEFNIGGTILLQAKGEEIQEYYDV